MNPFLEAIRQSMRQEARGFKAVRMSISERFKVDYAAHVAAAEAAAEAGNDKRERWEYSLAQLVIRQLQEVIG